ncbi:MAG: hypothetical protein Q8R85_21950 [Bosea sp. (in: a-proteobacteria)]|uniref:hypothetical protein n=1 Tax=Bosea sp. (in: a-proteobacteria) TaxID=1871050 RepID=UPI002732C8A4|nr:hypothetical protein [Bosea sp. (in: a-proteobacteria)]MDP3603827.1 hypothetical protein [Bosea sp. (in: a-proteobacteria)]
MKIDDNQKARNKSTNIKKNSPRHTLGLGGAVKSISERNSDFDSSNLFGILSNGGITAFIITEYGRIPIPQTYWAGITKGDLPRLNVLNWLAVKYQDLLPLVTMQVVAARSFLREFGNLDSGAAFEARYPDLAMWLRTNTTKGIALKSEEIRDKLDELLAVLANPVTKKYLPRVTRSEIDSYIGGRDGLPKQKTGRTPSAMPDEFWLELLKYFAPFKNRLPVKTISGKMLGWFEDKAGSGSLEAAKYNEVRIKEIVHSINGIGKAGTGDSGV